MMTRRHFRALAAAFHDMPDDADVRTWNLALRAVADVCAADNGRFDRGRFTYAAEHGRTITATAVREDEDR